MRIEVGRGLEGALTDLVEQADHRRDDHAAVFAGRFRRRHHRRRRADDRVVDGEPLPAPRSALEGAAAASADRLPIPLRHRLRRLDGVARAASGARWVRSRPAASPAPSPGCSRRLLGLAVGVGFFGLVALADARIRQRRPLVEPARPRRLDDRRLGRGGGFGGRRRRRIRRRRRQLRRRRRVGALVDDATRARAASPVRNPLGHAPPIHADGARAHRAGAGRASRAGTRARSASRSKPPSTCRNSGTA